MDECGKILNDYVSTHNKKFDICFIFCEFKIQFDNSFTAGLKTNCERNKEIGKISQRFLNCIESLESKGYKFHNVNQMTINTFSDRCNMKYEQYMHPPRKPLKTKIKMIIAENPQLIDLNINHLLIRKNSHLSFDD